MDLGPGQVYRSPQGDLMLYVRRESRDGVEGAVLAGARGRVVYTRWVPKGEEVPGELVNDTGGRRDAVLMGLYALNVEKERDALAETMKRAVQWLSDSQAEELRRFYFKELAR